MSVIETPEVPTVEPLVEPDPVLLRAAEIVRERWQQGDVGLEGQPRCAIGAISEAAVCSLGEYLNAVDRLHFSLGEHIGPWNDAPGRTSEEVAEALERAAIGL